jgi:hypothetical protein
MGMSVSTPSHMVAATNGQPFLSPFNELVPRRSRFRELRCNSPFAVRVFRNSAPIQQDICLQTCHLTHRSNGKQAHHHTRSPNNTSHLNCEMTLALHQLLESNILLNWCRIAKYTNGEWRIAAQFAKSRSTSGRGTSSLNGERNGCPLVAATIWDGVDTLIPISRAHPTPVGPATYFV